MGPCITKPNESKVQSRLMAYNNLKILKFFETEKKVGKRSEKGQRERVRKVTEVKGVQ